MRQEVETRANGCDEKHLPSAHAAVMWLEWQLRGDKKAAAYFVGKDCGICTDKQWTVQRKNLPAQ